MQRTSNVDVTRNSVSPNRWQGERGCLIGPFSSRTATVAFITYVLTLNHVQISPEDIFARRGAYFIRVSAHPAAQMHAAKEVYGD